MKHIMHCLIVCGILACLPGCDGDEESSTVDSSAGVERTLAIIKPDAVQAKNSGKIIDIIERHGFDIVQLDKRRLKRSDVEQYYGEHRQKPFFATLVDYMTSGPVVLMVLQKQNAIAEWRALMGVTNPEKAQAGTIRKQFGTDITKNAVHGSDSAESAQKEIAFFFPESATQICDY